MCYLILAESALPLLKQSKGQHYALFLMHMYNFFHTFAFRWKWGGRHAHDQTPDREELGKDFRQDLHVSDAGGHAETGLSVRAVLHS